MKKITSILFSAIFCLSLSSCVHNSPPQEKTTPTTNSTTATTYECPMKCEPATDKPGKCGKCGMDLKEVKK
jgi:PBP1b-binding outer membrane lipoprotein LpoB